MTKEEFETKIIQERCLADRRWLLENYIKKDFPQNEANEILLKFDTLLKNYEASLKGTNHSFSILDFYADHGNSSDDLSKFIKEDCIRSALYDASYEYLNSDDYYYDASKEIIDPILVINNKDK